MTHPVSAYVASDPRLLLAALPTVVPSDPRVRAAAVASSLSAVQDIAAPAYERDDNVPSGHAPPPTYPPSHLPISSAASLYLPGYGALPIAAPFNPESTITAGGDDEDDDEHLSAADRAARAARRNELLKQRLAARSSALTTGLAAEKPAETVNRIHNCISIVVATHSHPAL